MPKIHQTGFASSKGARVSAPLHGPGTLEIVTGGLARLAGSLQEFIAKRDEIRQRDEMSKSVTEAELRIAKGVRDLKAKPDPDNHAAAVSELIKLVTGEILGGSRLSEANRVDLISDLRKISLKYEVQGHTEQAAMVVDRGRGEYLETVRFYEDLLVQADAEDHIRLTEEFKQVTARAVVNGYQKAEEAQNVLNTMLDRAAFRRAELIAFENPEAILRSKSVVEEFGIRPHQEDDIIGKALAALKSQDALLDRALTRKRKEADSDIIVAAVNKKLTPKMIRELAPFLSREAVTWATNQLTDPTAVPVDPILLRDIQVGVAEGTTGPVQVKNLIFTGQLPGDVGMDLFNKAILVQRKEFQEAKRLLYAAAGVKDFIDIEPTDKAVKALIMEKLTEAMEAGKDLSTVGKEMLPLVKLMRTGGLRNAREIIESQLTRDGATGLPSHRAVKEMDPGPERVRQMQLWLRWRELMVEEEKLGNPTGK